MSRCERPGWSSRCEGNEISEESEAEGRANVLFSREEVLKPGVEVAAWEVLA